MVFHSDGVQSHVELEDYSGLRRDAVQTVADHLIQAFGKPYDDASCIVLRYKR